MNAAVYLEGEIGIVRDIRQWYGLGRYTLFFPKKENI